MPSRAVHEAMNVMRQNVLVVQALFPDFFDPEDIGENPPADIWPERLQNDQQIQLANENQRNLQRRALGFGRPQPNYQQNEAVMPFRFPSIRQLENRRRRSRKDHQCEEEEGVDR